MQFFRTRPWLSSCAPLASRVTPRPRPSSNRRSLHSGWPRPRGPGPDRHGQTAALVLPILQRLTATAVGQLHPLQRVANTAPRVLVLVPTRELAAQVHESVRAYGAHTGLRSLAVFGGVGINPQIQSLRRSIDIPPPRQAACSTISVSAPPTSRKSRLVLDEADRMFDMGFIRDTAASSSACRRYGRT